MSTTIIQHSLMSREGGSICVSASGQVCREDIEMLREVFALSLNVWPTLEELKVYVRCKSVDCAWEGQSRDRIQREGKGSTGCPRCGCEAEPRPFGKERP